MSDDSDRRVRVDQLNAEAKSLRWLDYDRVQLLADEAFELACQKDGGGDQYPYGMAAALGLLADRNCIVGEWNIALSEAAQALALLASQPVTPVVGWLHETVGWTRYFLGDYVLALDNLRTALRIAEETGDGSLEANVLDRIASVQGAVGQLHVSLDTHERALAMLREAGDRFGEARALNNMAYTYMDLGRLETALAAAERSLELTQEVGSVHLLAGVYDTLAEAELRSGHLAAAELYSRKGLETALACKAEPDAADSMFMLGRIECARGNWEEAVENTGRALAMAERLGRSVEEYECHKLLSEIHERSGDMGLALWHHRRFHDLESAKRNRETESRLDRLSVEHQVETARKDAEILRLRSLALEREVEERRVAQASLEAAASLDPLTGLFNRRHTAVLREELSKATARGLPVVPHHVRHRSLQVDQRRARARDGRHGARRHSGAAPQERAQVGHAVPLGRGRVPGPARRHGRGGCRERRRAIARGRGGRARGMRGCRRPGPTQRGSREHELALAGRLRCPRGRGRCGALRGQGGRPQPCPCRGGLGRLPEAALG